MADSPIYKNFSQELDSLFFKLIELIEDNELNLPDFVTGEVKKEIELLVQHTQNQGFDSINNLSDFKKSYLIDRLSNLRNLIEVFSKLSPDNQNGTIRKLAKFTKELKSNVLDDEFFSNNISNIDDKVDSLVKLIEVFTHERQRQFERFDLKIIELEKLEEKFNTTINLLEKQFEESTNRLEIEKKQSLDLLQEDSLKIKNKYQESVQENLDSLERLLDKQEDYNNLLSGRVISNSFSKRAAKEKWKGLSWTIGTWVFALATLASLGYIFYLQINNLIQDQSVNYSLLTTKVLITATLGFVAKWTSKRANRHLTEEAIYHRLSINSHTIKDYVKDLDEKSRNEVLKAAALKYFTEINGNETPAEFETANAIDLAKDFLTKK